jgi:hypothetical protein
VFVVGVVVIVAVPDGPLVDWVAVPVVPLWTYGWNVGPD